MGRLYISNQLTRHIKLNFKMKLVIISFVLYAGIDAFFPDTDNLSDWLYGDDNDKEKASDIHSFYNILNDDCEWQAASHGTYNTCDGGSVPRGFCGSGKHHDCYAIEGDTRSRQYNNKLKCCWAGSDFGNFMEVAVDNKYIERDAKNGKWVDCKNEGILMGVCASNGDPSCLSDSDGNKYTTQGICLDNKHVKAEDYWCETLVGNYGEDMSCPKDFIVTSICSSLGKGACYGNRKKGYAAIECCKAVSRHFA